MGHALAGHNASQTATPPLLTYLTAFTSAGENTPTDKAMLYAKFKKQILLPAQSRLSIFHLAAVLQIYSKQWTK